MTGHLSWPIKSSFRDYIQGMPDGIVSVDSGAQLFPESFHFPLQTPLDPEQPLPSEIRFGGDVQFEAHGGRLAILFSELRLEQVPSGGHRLTIDHPWSVDGSLPRLDLAEVRWNAWTGMRTRSESVTLSSQGASLFNNAYGRGSQLDQMSIDLGVAPLRPSDSPLGQDRQSS